MSNGELRERLLDMVKFGWIVQILHKLSKCSNVAQISPKLHKIPEYCTKLSKIAQVLRARPTQSIAHLTIAITLLLIASRDSLMSC